MAPAPTPTNITSIPEGYVSWPEAQQALLDDWSEQPHLKQLFTKQLSSWRADSESEAPPEVFFTALALYICLEAGNIWNEGSPQKLALLTDWLSLLPENDLQENPWLIYWRAQLRATQAPDWSHAQLTSAWESFQEKGDIYGQIVTSCAILESLLFGWTNFSTADRWIEYLDNCRLQPDTYPQTLMPRITAAIVAAISYRQPNHPGLPWWLEQAETLIDYHRSPAVLGSLGFPLYFHYLWSGDTPKRNRIAHWSLQALADNRQPPIIHIGICVVQAIQALFHGNHEELSQWVDQGKSLAISSGIRLWDPLLQAPFTYSALAQGNILSARQSIDFMAQSISLRGALDHAYYHHIASLVCLAEGDLAASQQHITEGLKAADNSGVPVAETYCRFSALMLANAEQNGEDFETHLMRLNTLANQLNSKWFRYLSALAQVVHTKPWQPSQKEQNQSLNQVLVDLGYEVGIHTFPWLSRSETAQLCAHSLEAKLRPSYIQDIIRRQKLTPPSDKVAVTNWPFPVRICTLGQFSLEWDEPPPGEGGSQRQRPQDLLQLLIALGSHGIPIARICELLWPEADGDFALQNLKTTVHRLRRLLGHKERLLWQHNCLSLNTNEIWIDALHFEQAINTLRQKSASADCLEKALTYYRGSFLADQSDSSIWAIPLRVRLRDLFLESAADCIDEYFSRKNYQHAQALANQALKAEPLGIPVWNALITGYELAGKEVAANLARERLNTLWQAETGQSAPPNLIVI